MSAQSVSSMEALQGIAQSLPEPDEPASRFAASVGGRLDALTMAAHSTAPIVGFPQFAGSGAGRPIRPSASAPITSPELSEAIQASREILQLQDDWDTEGSPSYSESTLARATRFLLSNALRYWRDHQRWVLAPRILPGPDGNIDLHWKTPQRELLITIPANPAEPAAYYGDDQEDGTENAIRGKRLDTSAYSEWIIAWLMR